MSLDNTDDCDILKERAVFCGKSNAILSDFAHHSSDVRFRMLIVYCTSFYGAQLWNLSNGQLQHLYAAMRVGIRKSFHLPNRCHNSIVELVSGRDPLSVIFHKWFVNFFKSCLSCENVLIKYLAIRASFTFASIIGKNLRFLNNLYNVNLLCDSKNLVFSRIEDSVRRRYSFEDVVVAQVIRDLVWHRDFVIDLFDENTNTQTYQEWVEEFCTR